MKQLWNVVRVNGFSVEEDPTRFGLVLYSTCKKHCFLLLKVKKISPHRSPPNILVSPFLGWGTFLRFSPILFSEEGLDDSPWSAEEG